LLKYYKNCEHNTSALKDLNQVLLQLIELLRNLFLPAQELTLPSEPSSFYVEERKRKKEEFLESY